MATNFINNNIAKLRLNDIIYNIKSVPFHATEAEWSQVQYTPQAGEVVYYDDIKQIKIGDGSSDINSLPFHLDTSLTTPGQAADAKSVGDALNNIETTLSQSILYVEQSLTPEQQLQARKNIGADATTDLLKMVYPVGAVYISTKSTSPASLFGGTWERIKDRFLLAAGSSYSAGSTGGEATHTLTKSEMPSVTGDISTHGVYTGTPIASVSGCFSVKSTVSEKYLGGSTSGANSISKIGFSNGGSGNAHNNMPPYLTVYVWKRIE